MNREFCLEKAGMEVTQDEVEELYRFLQGETPKGFYFNETPNLSEEAAFSVIYYLQEKMHLIPDNFERCSKCGKIFDSDEEDISSPYTDKIICDSCFSYDDVDNDFDDYDDEL